MVVAIPMVHQTPALLEFAHACLAAALPLGLASAVAMAWRAWRARSARAWTLLGITLLCVWLAHANLFEWMFAPAHSAQFADIGEFHEIRDSDMVIGVVLGGQSRAYPVRYLAYHHMLNDQLGATALLPTY